MELRTTTQMSTNSLIAYMQSNMQAYNKLSQEIASGTKVLVPSDDPIAAIQILNDGTDINKLTGYNTNITTAQNEINVVDGALTSMISSLQKAHDLSVQAANGTNGTSSYAAIKTQIDQIIQNLKDLGNTQYNNTYVFAGTNTTTSPYQDSATGMAYTGTTTSGNWKRYAQIADNSNVAINVTGDAVLGSYDTTTGTGSGAMASLYKLSAALSSQDTAAIKTSVGNLLNDTDTVSNARTNMAALTNRLTATTTSNSSKITILKEDRGGVQDIDMATSVTNMYSSQASYQASMSVVSSLLKLGTLWDYMQ